MSTVGRIGWMRALTKVLTRSRGTPAAAFAMYCSRNVLVDTRLGDYSKPRGQGPSFNAELPTSNSHRLGVGSWAWSLLRERGPGVRRDPDVLVDRARDARVDRAGAAEGRSQMDQVRRRAVAVVRADPARVDDTSRRAVLADFDLGEIRAPGHFPEVPPLVAERAANAVAVEDGVFAAADDDAEGDGAGQEIAASALLDGEPVVVRRDVGRAFLHAHDLRLVARRPFVEARDHDRELAGRQRLRQLVGDTALGGQQLEPVLDELHGTDRRADRPADRQRIPDLRAAHVG